MPCERESKHLALTEINKEAISYSYGSSLNYIFLFSRLLNHARPKKPRVATYNTGIAC